MMLETETKPSLKTSFWGVVSSLIITALFLAPVLVLALGGTGKGSLIVAGLLVVFFWPSCVIVARLAIKERELPLIVGGPRMIRAWKRPTASR